MQEFKYKVIPAPTQGKRAKGAKGAAGRFANALSELINEQAESGWEYVCAESLPSQDRPGIFRKRVETYQNVLIFRRPEYNEASQDEASEDTSGSPFRRFGKRKNKATDERVEPRIESVDDTIEEIVESSTEEAVEKFVEEASETVAKAD